MIDGPRLAPASGGPARNLVIFCHGFGADGNDLIGLGREWQRLLPHAAFASPHAPEPCAGAPMGRQWFPISRLDPAEYWTGVCHAAPALAAFIDHEAASFGLGAAQVALVGFSQGTMLALHVGLRRREALAAIVGYSGALAGPEHLGAELASAPPILLVHGDRDDLIPVQALFHAAQELGEAGLSVRWHVSNGTGHGIDPTGLALGGEFLRDAFAGKLAMPMGY
jgi:phospholipase/carboxylesterase